MAIVFNVANSVPYANGSMMRNRRAAMRQTEEMRNKVYAKYQSLVGKRYGFANSMAARRAANEELNNPKLHPEYWDNDSQPRKTLNMSSSCFAKAIPAAGGVFLYFRSNDKKAYFYPCAGTTAGTAERLAKLLKSPSIGRAYLNGWGAQNGAKKVMSKSGKSSYQLSGGRTLNLKRFDKMGRKLGK